MKVILQILQFRLHRNADTMLTARSYGRVENWLKGWTPNGNFRAVLANSTEEGLTTLFNELQKHLVPGWLEREEGVRPDMFSVFIKEVVVEDGRMWLSDTITRGGWYDIPEELCANSPK